MRCFDKYEMIKAGMIGFAIAILIMYLVYVI